MAKRSDAATSLGWDTGRAVTNAVAITDFARFRDLLTLLARHPGRVFQRSELLDLVWGYDFPGYTRTVDVHVQQLREKLAAAGVTAPSIETVWGVGYRLELAAS